MNDNVDTLARLMAAKALAGGGGGGGTVELFWCTYGTTTLAEVKAAVTAGKLPVCKYNDDVYVCSMCATYSARFTAAYYAGTLKQLYLGSTTIGWMNSASALVSNPLTTAEDLIVGNGDTNVKRLAKGNYCDILTVGYGGTLQWRKNLPILTEAPTADNTTGGLIMVVLDAEPTDYYDGYYYIITESTVQANANTRTITPDLRRDIVIPEGEDSEDDSEEAEETEETEDETDETEGETAEEETEGGEPEGEDAPAEEMR